MSTFPYSCISFHQRFWDWLKQYCPWVLQGAAVPYGMIVKIRRMAYQRNWLLQHHLPKPVVSVGNLTVGGTGKTPFVIWLAHQLHSKGKRVAILSRGYGRQRSSQNLMVSNGQGQIKEWRAVGDEPWMIAQNCPWAIVAVGPDRHRLGKWVLEKSGCDFFILDDGYQHLSLYRDLDVLLFDSMDINGLSGVLPSGRLREPFEAIKGNEAFVFTRVNSLSSIHPVRKRIEESLGKPISPIILKTVPKQVQHLVTGEVRPLEFLLETPLLVVSAIGNPRSFRDILTRCGFEVCEEIQFRDHCAYGQDEVGLIRNKMDEFNNKIVMTTEKDAVKLREWFTKDDPFWVLITEIEFPLGGDHLMHLLDCSGFK